MSSPKRFVPLSEEVIREALRLSEKSGIPLRDFIEKTVSSVISYMRYRPDLLNSLHTLDAIEDIRRMGCVMLPQGVVKKILETLPEKDFQDILDELGKAASWYGVVANAKRGASIESIQTALQLWLPGVDVHVSRSQGSGTFYKLVFSPQAHMASERLSAVIETIASNIASSMGARLVSVENHRGVLSMVIQVGSE